MENTKHEIVDNEQEITIKLKRKSIPILTGALVLGYNLEILCDHLWCKISNDPEVSCWGGNVLDIVQEVKDQTGIHEEDKGSGEYTGFIKTIGDLVKVKGEEWEGIGDELFKEVEDEPTISKKPYSGWTAVDFNKAIEHIPNVIRKRDGEKLNNGIKADLVNATSDIEHKVHP